MRSRWCCSGGSATLRLRATDAQERERGAVRRKSGLEGGFYRNEGKDKRAR
jgi:hypothetical protein